MSSDKREFWWKEVSFDETNNIQLLQWLCNSLKLFLIRLISLYIIVFNGSNVKVKFSCKGYQSTSSRTNPMKRVTPSDQFKSHLKPQKKWFSPDFILFKFKGSKGSKTLGYAKYTTGWDSTTSSLTWSLCEGYSTVLNLQSRDWGYSRVHQLRTGTIS